MNFKKPKSADIQSTVAVVGGAVVGGMVSGGVINMIHKPTGDAQKDSNMETIKRTALAIITGYGATSVQGNDLASSFTRGSLLGMAINQLVAVTQNLAKKSAPATSNRFVQGALGYPCDGCMPRLNVPQLVIPQSYNAEPRAIGSGNAFDMAIDEASYLN